MGVRSESPLPGTNSPRRRALDASQDFIGTSLPLFLRNVNIQIEHSWTSATSCSKDMVRPLLDDIDVGAEPHLDSDFVSELCWEDFCKDHWGEASVVGRCLQFMQKLQ